MTHATFYSQIDTQQIARLDDCASSDLSPPGKYSATQSSPLREQKRVVLKGEDDHLPQRDRDRLQSNTWDEHRNYAVAGWVTRKHLDFVATHNFDCTSDDQTLDEDIEGIVEDWGDADNFDERGRLCLHDHVRIDEACRTVGGDILLQKLVNGRVQAIESDRVRDPDKPMKRNRHRWKNGVLENSAGRTTHFSIHKRTRFGGFKFETILPAHEVYHFKYQMRHDQARGISPYSSSLDYFRQTNKAIQFAQAKQLLSQMFGLIIKRDDPQSGKVSLTNGPFVTEIGLDENADLLTDKTPSTEFDNFLRHVIGISMKGLDLPYNFYDEAHTNFFGSRAALNLYLMSCLAKRRGVQKMLKHLTKWRLNYEISIGNLRLPRSMDIDQIYRRYCNWIPIGVQWWNPSQEAKAAETLLNLRLRSRTELRRETHGDSWMSLQDQIDAEEQRIANANFESSITVKEIKQMIDEAIQAHVAA